MRLSPVRRTLLISLPLGILFGATGALAGVSYLDEADEHVDRAASALKKADDPTKAGEYGGHRKKALDLLDDAKKEIRKAKNFVSEKPPTTPPGHTPKPDPTASGPKKPPVKPPPPPKKGDDDPPPPKK